MTISLERIKLYPDESKRLIGIKYEDFIVLVTLAEKKQKLKKEKFRVSASQTLLTGGLWQRY
ncbi:hypothetical protein LC612_25890 [Nostoc sp. CHAB 5834]|nr:hypothetical protein [Nostoc sp. CHAB 5834]